MQDTEIFLPIKGHEGIYEISNHGRVKSLSRIDANGLTRKEKILSFSKSTKGYCILNLRPNKRTIFRTSVHRLVAEAFIENPKNYKEVNHIDGIKTNNYVFNLEWCSRSQNVKHSYDNKLLVPKMGELNKSAKLTKSQVLDCLNMPTKDAMKKYNVSSSAIKSIKNGRLWGHLTGIVKNNLHSNKTL
jgi:hypothetical protein